MDITTLLGLVIGITVVLLAVLTGSDLWIFINIPGLLIVLGGTLAATLIKFPLSTVFYAFVIGTKAAFVTEKDDARSLIDQSLTLAKEVRAGGLLALEKAEIRDPFFKKGVQLVVDGHGEEVVTRALTSEMELSIKRHEEGSDIFKAIGDSAPAFGMIGTLVGLVQMLSNMEDPKSIGPAMAIALLTTLYGALIANLIALPISAKLKKKTDQERMSKLLILDTIVALLNKTNPNVLAELLVGYLPEAQRAKREAEATAAKN